MRYKITLGLLCLVVGVASCGVDTNDPRGAGAAGAAEAIGEQAEPSQPAPSGPEPAGTRDDPLPARSTFVMSHRIDGEAEPVALWEIALGPTNMDATEEVLGESQLNEIADGRRAVMTEVTAKYVGPESGHAWVDLNFTYLGSDGDRFDNGMDDYCGIVPNSLLNHGEQSPGTTVKGNVCEAVPEDVIDGGMWMVAFAFTWDDRRVFVKTD